VREGFRAAAAGRDAPPPGPGLGLIGPGGLLSAPGRWFLLGVFLTALLFLFLPKKAYASWSPGFLSLSPWRFAQTVAEYSRSHPVFSDLGASSPEAVDSFNLLAALDVFRGERGVGSEARPRAGVTRAEMSALLVRLLGEEAQAQVLAESGAWRRMSSVFRDGGELEELSWARGPVARAWELGLIQGRPDGRFAPREGVTLAEALTMVLRLLGREKEAREPVLGEIPPWPEGEMALGRSLGLLDWAGEDPSPGKALTREEVALLLDRTLRVSRRDPASGEERGPLLGDPRRYPLEAGLLREILPGGRVELETGEGAKVRRLGTRVVVRGAGKLEGLLGRRVRLVSLSGQAEVVYVEPAR